MTSWLPINPTYGISNFDRIFDSPLVLFLHAELGIVSSVYDEIDAVFFSIDMFYEIFCLVVATLGVAHQDEADRVFIFCCCLDKRDVVVVDIAFGNGEPPSYGW